MNRLRAEWFGYGRQARHPPDPAYPNGVTRDLSRGAGRACTIDLPWPAPECGQWLVTCPDCGLRIAVTAAGRADDPRRLTFPCRRPS